MSFYKCSKCNFIFHRKASVDVCPYCEHGYVLAAAEADIAEYEKNQKVSAGIILSKEVDCNGKDKDL